jgi:hypothetical protein
MLPAPMMPTPIFPFLSFFVIGLRGSILPASTTISRSACLVLHPAMR